jgi:hypothetical protein
MSFNLNTKINNLSNYVYRPPQATYYKSVQQNLVNGSTDITFDTVGSWSNIEGYITHVSGTKDFTVARTGLYQLEFNLSVIPNGATWNTAVNKSVNIDITRPPVPEQAIIQNNAVVANNLPYHQSVASTFYLEVGDVINLRSFLAFASAVPYAQGVQNGIDLNTFFSWRYVSQ